MTLSPDARVRRRRVRSGAAVIVIIAWAAAVAGLIQREVVRSPSDRLAEVALRVNPGNVFYGVDQNGRRVGWASSTIDTLADSLTQRSDTLSLLDELVADVPVAGKLQRTSTRTQIMLSRTFALRRFVVDVDTNGVSTRLTGRMVGDTSIAVVRETNGVASDTQRIRVSGPVLLPPMVSLATILRGPPKVGRRATYTEFDPQSRTTREVTMAILAESLFVVDDSAGMDANTGRFVSSLRDTVRAWKIAERNGSGGASAWVDAQGRVVETSALGSLQLSRTAYELSFENWRLDTKAAARAAAGESDIHTSSVIAAEVPIPRARLQSLKLRLTAPTLNGLALRGGRQQLDGNVLSIAVEPAQQFVAVYAMPATPQHRTQFRAELQAEPFLETRTPAMLKQAIAIVKHERDPRAMAELLVRWVADSVQRSVTFAMPDAVAVLRARTGDTNDHAQLFTALARSLDIPTRTVSGLLYVNGQFYYHAWAEIFLRDWVAVDPTYGELPADAARVRLATGGLERQAELVRRIGTLHIDVIEAR